MTDPPVVSVDEASPGLWIPLYPDMWRRAMSLQDALQTGWGAVPVITTATDVNGKFAVDLFAAAYHMEDHGPERSQKYISSSPGWKEDRRFQWICP